MLLEVFIIQKGTSFLLIRRSFTNKEFQIDGGLFSGLITAISQFINELHIGDIQFLETGEHRILISPYKNIIVVGIVEERKEDPFVKRALEKVTHRFWEEYKEELNEWNGNVGIFSRFIQQIDDIVYSEFTEYYITQDFPKHVISIVREFQQKFNPDVIKFIGYKAGKKRSMPHNSIRSFKKHLERELNLFSITNISVNRKNEFDISIPICPVCRGITDAHFSCKFIEGFLQGYSEISFPTHKIHAEEVECMAHGDKTCKFHISIS